MNTVMNPNLKYARITDAVMARVAKRRLSAVRISTAAHGLISLAAIIALVPAFQYAFASAAQSGFSGYLSLIASDGGSLATYWKDLGLTLVESAPIVGCAAILGVLLIFVYNARKTVGDWSRMHASALRA